MSGLITEVINAHPRSSTLITEVIGRRRSSLRSSTLITEVIDAHH
jgi:hypothetical protein